MRLLPVRPDHGGGSASEAKANPTDEDINTITNICRSGTYVRVRRAIHRAATA